MDECDLPRRSLLITYENDNACLQDGQDGGSGFQASTNWKPAKQRYNGVYEEFRGQHPVAGKAANYDELNGLITQNQTSTDAAIREAENEK